MNEVGCSAAELRHASATSAFGWVRLLRRAQIVCTIHQPSSDICNMFDDLILMSCGRLLYCGSWMAADTYFADAGFKCAARAPSRPAWTCMQLATCLSAFVRDVSDKALQPESLWACRQQKHPVHGSEPAPCDAGSQNTELACASLGPCMYSRAGLLGH